MKYVNIFHANLNYAYTSKPGEVDIDTFHGEENRESCAYLRSSLHCEVGRTNADLRLECTTGAKIWLNGELILNGVQKDRILVVLNKGWNTFIVKVAQGTDANREFRARLAVVTSGCGKVQAVPGLPTNFHDAADKPIAKEAVELRLDSPDGELIGTVEYGAESTNVKPVKGKHDLFMVFPNGNVKELDWYKFTKESIKGTITPKGDVEDTE